MSVDEHTKTPTAIPPAKDPRNENNPEPIKAKQWRNLYFLKDGKSGFGKMIFDDEQEAQMTAEGMLLEITLGAIFGATYTLPCGLEISIRTFSHHMQIPWSKDE